MTDAAAPKVKVAPNSKESEMMVLGCMLTSINSLNIAADALDDSDFYYTEHKIIFQVLKTAYRSEKPADVHLVCEELKRQGKLAAVGGVSYMTTLAQYAGTSAYIEEYTEIIRNKSMLRRMIHAAQIVEKNALEEPSDVSNALDDAQQLFFKISQSANPVAGILIKELLTGVKAQSAKPYLKELQERQENFQTRGPEDPGITGLPTYFTDLDKLVNGLNASNLIILAARPAMGKCVVKGTPILNPQTGRLTPIEQLVACRSGRVATLTQDWKLKETAPSAYVADGMKQTFKVTTALGKEIEATAPHPFLTIRGWKKLSELAVGDRIAVPRQLPFFGSKQWPRHRLKLLAYLIADGNLTDSLPRFANHNPLLLEDFAAAVKAFDPASAPTLNRALERPILFQLKAQLSQALQDLSRLAQRALFQIARELSLARSAGSTWAYAANLPSPHAAAALHERCCAFPHAAAAVQRNPLKAWMRELGLDGKSAHLKFVPPEVFELSKENLALFLNRMFACHGRAYAAQRAGRPCSVIAYASVSKTMIQQMQHLLLRFGILSKIRPKQTSLQKAAAATDEREDMPTAVEKSLAPLRKQAPPSYELEIHGRDDLIRFACEIGIFGKEKAIDDLLDASATTPNADWSKDWLPLEIWELIRAKKGKRSWASLFRAKGLPAPSDLHEGGAILRSTLAKCANVLDDDELRAISASDVYWDRIASIASTGKQEVFDLTVEDTHNFVAADFIVHNTACALNIAENVCFKAKKPVGIFSLEMSAEQLLHRIICSQSQVEAEKIKTGSLNGMEFQRIVAAVNEMQKHEMIIDDQPGLKITDLRARARRMKETYNIGLLIVDYLQLISGANTARNVESRQNEISEISRMLKTLARELDLPLICLSQLSRKVEDRAGHRPMMSDLRESGCLAGETRIRDALSGREYAIRELAERETQTPLLVEGVDVAGWKLGHFVMSRVFYSGRKRVFELKTRSGRKIRASANHPFLKRQGWAPLEALRLGDEIAVPRQTLQQRFGAQALRAPIGDRQERSCSAQPSSAIVQTAALCKTGSGEPDLLLDEIISLSALGVEDVYDATVEGAHNFVADDIVVHNSIEQDADIVMFLLRREYYDPLDKPGMAELIVAKNRHGAVGSVNLTFRKEYAQFANYAPIQDQVVYDPGAEEAFKEFTPN